MTKGIVILRGPAATTELQAQAVEVLTGAGWACELRQRFDGTLAVAFDRAVSRDVGDDGDVEALLRKHPLLGAVDLEIREVG